MIKRNRKYKIHLRVKYSRVASIVKRFAPGVNAIINSDACLPDDIYNNMINLEFKQALIYGMTLNLLEYNIIIKRLGIKDAVKRYDDILDSQYETRLPKGWRI